MREITDTINWFPQSVTPRPFHMELSIRESLIWQLVCLTQVITCCISYDLKEKKREEQDFAYSKTWPLKNE